MPTWLIYAILSMIFAGLTSVLAKTGLKDISADLALVVRTTVVFGMVIINFLLWQEVKSFNQLTSKALVFLILSGLTTSFSWIFYYKAIKIGDVSMIASIDKGSLLITLLLSFSDFKRTYDTKGNYGSRVNFFGDVGIGMEVIRWYL